MPAAGAGNTNANPSNIIFTIKGTKLYVPVVTLSAIDNEKLSKILSKGYERSVYKSEYKTKTENKNTANKYRYFLESSFVEVNRLFLLLYSNQDDSFKRFRAKRHYIPKGIIKNCNVIVHGKNVYDQAVDSPINDMNKLKN